MPELKLTYFDAPMSRGEECRLTLALAGVEFEDHRVRRDEWPALKPLLGLGRMPVLVVEGKGELTEVNAIMSFVGRKYGLSPSDAWEAGREAEVLSACEDLRHQVSRTFGIKDPEELLKRRTELVGGPIPVWARAMEKRIGGPFFHGDAAGISDIKLYMMVRWLTGGALDHVPNTVLAAYPKLTRLAREVRGHSRLKAWFDKYPA